MPEKKQSFYKRVIEPHMGLSIFITILTFGIGAYLTNEKDKLNREAKDKEMELRIYPTPQRLIKAMEHDDEVPSDVENFQREIRLIKTGDTLVEFQKEIKESVRIIDSFYVFAKDKAYNDSIKDVEKQTSRDKRTKDVDDIKRENQNIGNTLQAIQRQLDSMN